MTEVKGWIRAVEGLIKVWYTCEGCRDIKTDDPTRDGWQEKFLFGPAVYDKIVGRVFTLCPRCVVEWPKYLEYTRLKNEEVVRLRLRWDRVTSLYPGPAPGFQLRGDGTLQYWDTEDWGLETPDDFARAIGALIEAESYMRSFDGAVRDKIIRKRQQYERITERLRDRIDRTTPKPYQRWLAGER